MLFLECGIGGLYRILEIVFKRTVCEKYWNILYIICTKIVMCKWQIVHNLPYFRKEQLDYMGLGNMLCVFVLYVCVRTSKCFNFWTPHRVFQVGYNLALKAAPNSRGPALRTTSLCYWVKQTYKHDYVVCMCVMYVCMYVVCIMYVCM
jgi:hypothetical protein